MAGNPGNLWRFDCYTRGALHGPFAGSWGTRVGC